MTIQQGGAGEANLSTSEWRSGTLDKCPHLHILYIPVPITHLLFSGSSLHLPVLLIQDAEGREWWILPCSTKLEWLENEGCLLIQLLPNSSPAMLPWSTYPGYIVFSFRKCFTEVWVKVCVSWLVYILWGRGVKLNSIAIKALDQCQISKFIPTCCTGIWIFNY